VRRALTAVAVPFALVLQAFFATPFAQAPAQTTRSVWDGIYTEAQAGRGAALYASGCARCHGPDLRGGEMAPPVSGGDFRWNWNGVSVGQLFERLRVTMPLDGPERMTRDEKADVLAFMLQVNEYPAGASELPGRAEVLEQIRFEAIRQKP
jgi:quinoprotein glucose dehydrogenase